ncbi:MAG: mechanosensitive ion channel family protein [Schleiferiaceae bacterium]|nr:mechanosensitive ion channel family protein [Schleiferiaceae bacterium]
MQENEYAKYDFGLWLRNWLFDKGLNEYVVDIIGFSADVLVILLAVVITDFVTRKVILNVIQQLVKKTKTHWDDYFYEQRVFRNIAHIVPALVVQAMLPIVFNELPDSISNFLNTAIKVYVVILLTVVINKVLKALENLSENDNSKLHHQQMRSISQVMRILVIFVSVLIVISILFKIKLGGLLGGMAGATAILILVFQDTIKGLLANFQINMYDLINKGDWITFNKYGVDGDVVSIDLTTVKVRNWDKTISSVPAVAFVSDSFVNWRGMQETNARRIKRDILIDIRSISFANDEMINRLKKIDLIKDYLVEKESELSAFNEKIEGSDLLPINGRTQTNIGIYRAYVLAYLKHHPKVSSDLSLMVRQLQPTEKGLPIEVYCFSTDIVWANYEDIQADIFDHLFAATHFFDLRLYQNPGGYELEKLSSKNA